MGSIQTKEIDIPQKIINNWQKIVDIMAGLIGVTAGLIMKVNSPYIEVFRSSHTKDNPYTAGYKEKMEGLYCEEVIKTDEKLLIPNALKDDKWKDNPDIELGMISYLGFPLKWPDGEFFGTICILDKKENKFSDRIENLIKQFKELIESHLENISQKQKLEKVLKDKEQLEEKYRTTLHSIGDGVITTDNNGCIDIMNPAAEKLTGFSFKEAKGRPLKEIFKIVNAHTREEVKKPAREVLENGKKVGLANHTLLISKKGYEYQIADSAAPIRDDEDNIIGVVLVFIDVTNEYQMQEELKEREERFQKMLAVIPDMISVQDTDMNIIYSNWKGYAAVPEEKRILNTKCHKTYRNMDEICPDCQAKTVLQTKEAFQAEKKRPDGKWEDLRVMPFFGDDDNIQFFLEWVRDITEIKKSEEDLQRSNEELEQHRKDLEKRMHQSVNAISKIGELRDVYTAGHQKKVAALSCAIGSAMGLVAEQINNLSFGALIHDIGKIYIPSEILNKPGKISALEYQILQTHVEESYKVVKEIDFPEEIHTMIYQHHERLDGSGYPQRLSGDEIILQSRILAVADVVEAMTSHRPYRAALGIDAALEEILLHRGTKYAR